MWHIIEFISLVMLMLVTGVFWGPWFALSRSLRIFGAKEFVQIASTMAKNLAGPMRIMLPGSVVLIALSAWCYPQKDSLGFILNIAALLLIISALLVTVIVEVPIVKQILAWNQAGIPSNWEMLRNRWLYFHVVRVLASVAGFAAYAAAVLALS